MISVKEAEDFIRERARPLPEISMSLNHAAGLILTQPVISTIDMPPFPQSAMDGYAFKFSHLENYKSLKVAGEIPAGYPPLPEPGFGEAVRIFTGAPLPDGTDTVVMQEKVRINGDAITIMDEMLKPGSNVRPRASQSRTGEVVLTAGTRLGAGAMGLLAGLGTTVVKVIPQPRIGLIVTGKELVPPGVPLRSGQVYESNSFALTTALHEMNIKPTVLFHSDDNEDEITGYIRSAIAQCDLVLVTGGISVGAYDHVKRAMDHCQVETIFHKVKQKPGKPLYFGRYKNTLVFGLPGNPASVLTCFYHYVVKAIEIMLGKNSDSGKLMKKLISQDYAKKPGLTHMLKGKLNGDQVIPLDAQESYKMNSFAQADCLIMLKEEQADCHQGETVDVQLI